MTDAYDFFQQGRSHLKGGMAAQATVALEKAKKLEPDKASIREALGIAYFRIQRWREAEAEFRAVLELSPTDDYAHYALGRALEKQGRDAEANGHYKLASSLSPNSEHYAERIMELDEPGEDARSVVKAVLQRVSRASVLGRGRGARRDRRRACSSCSASRAGTSDADAERLAGKVARLRVFEDDDGRFDRSLLDTGGAALVVSQFTLLADTAKGNRPSFSGGGGAGARRAALRALLRRPARARRPGRDG